MLKRATVIIKNSEKKSIVNPTNTMQGGGGIDSGPYFVDFELSSSDLLERILDALNLSKENVPKPEDMKIYQKEYLKGIGVKSLKDLYNNSIMLSIHAKDDILTFSPLENIGGRKGFVGTNERVSFPIDIPKDSMIEKLELALSRCK